MLNALKTWSYETWKSSMVSECRLVLFPQTKTTTVSATLLFRTSQCITQSSQSTSRPTQVSQTLCFLVQVVKSQTFCTKTCQSETPFGSIFTSDLSNRNSLMAVDLDACSTHLCPAKLNLLFPFQTLLCATLLLTEAFSSLE